MNTQPDVDIVIATYGRGPLIDATIASIRAGDLTSFTLWIVDQSEDDATERAVAPHAAADKRVRYLRSAERGISIARNFGVRHGRAPYILFTDDDCIAETRWASALVHELRQRNTWAVFGRVLPDKGEHGPSDATPVGPSISMALKDAPRRRVYQDSRLDLSFGHGASMGLRREIFERVGGFDELLGVGGTLRSWNDRDIGYRVLTHGGQIVYTPEALMYHRHWRGWEEVRRTYRNYAIGAGAAAAKYIRCGDPAGWYMLAEWVLDQGLRQVISGMFKWHSTQKIQVGMLQLVYPWVGVMQSLRYDVDRTHVLYRRSCHA